MKKNKGRRVMFFLSLFLIAAVYFYFENPDLDSVTGLVEKDIEVIKSVKVANWNLQIFGQKKAKNVTLMNYYATKIKEYDIIFIQEIRDSSGEAFEQLCSMLQTEYTCMISSRAGTTSSKEQYGVIYKKSIDFEDAVDYNPYAEEFFERPPLKTEFDFGTYDLNIFNIHVKPDNVQTELENLEALTVEENGATMIIGDLNTDCTYYDNEKEIEFDSWHWVIKDDEDTTVSNTNCAYDRIIVNDLLEEKVISYGIDDTIPLGASDHYLVWVELLIE